MRRSQHILWICYKIFDWMIYYYQNCHLKLELLAYCFGIWIKEMIKIRGCKSSFLIFYNILFWDIYMAIITIANSKLFRGFYWPVWKEIYVYVNVKAVSCLSMFFYNSEEIAKTVIINFSARSLKSDVYVWTVVYDFISDNKFSQHDSAAFNA